MKKKKNRAACTATSGGRPLCWHQIQPPPRLISQILSPLTIRQLDLAAPSSRVASHPPTIIVKSGRLATHHQGWPTPHKGKKTHRLSMTSLWATRSPRGRGQLDLAAPNPPVVTTQKMIKFLFFGGCLGGCGGGRSVSFLI